jgi:hypothetical protein
MSLAFSGSKRKIRKKPTEAGSKLSRQHNVCFCWFLIWFKLYPEDEGDVFFRTIGLSRTAGRYNPKDRDLNSHRCDNLKSTKINA